MIYQNYDIGTSNDGYASKTKESKRQEKLAKKAAKNAERAAKAEAGRQRAQRKIEARAILDNKGYTDIALANIKQDPSCSGPGCPPMAVSRNVALANRNLMQQGRTASMNARPGAPAGYGYYRDGNRQVPVPVTKDGYVRKDYLMAVQRGRSPRAVAMDSAKPSAKVYPARVTPKQAGPWIKNPGYADIPGIDAPKGTRPTVYVSRNAAPVPAKVPVTVRQPVAVSRNVSHAQPPYMSARAVMPVSKGVSGVRMRDPQGRTFVVPVNKNGTVPKAYLHNINDARPERARQRDARMTSRYVIPASPTPYQARPWIVNPGRYDIPGVDAPSGQPVTYRTARSPEAANRKRQVASKKTAATKPRENGRFVSADEAKRKGTQSGKPTAKKPSTAKKKAPSKTATKAPVKKAPAKKVSKPAQPVKKTAPKKPSAAKTAKRAPSKAPSNTAGRQTTLAVNNRKKAGSAQARKR